MKKLSQIVFYFFTVIILFANLIFGLMRFDYMWFFQWTLFFGPLLLIVLSIILFILKDKRKYFYLPLSLMVFFVINAILTNYYTNPDHIVLIIMAMVFINIAFIYCSKIELKTFIGKSIFVLIYYLVSILFIFANAFILSWDFGGV